MPEVSEQTLEQRIAYFSLRVNMLTRMVALFERVKPILSEDRAQVYLDKISQTRAEVNDEWETIKAILHGGLH